MDADRFDPTAGPRRTTILIGQEEAERALLDAYRSGRMPHGWMLTGPKGIGKATLAFRFARFLLAQGAGEGGGGRDMFGGGPDSLAVDELNPVQARILSGGHADLLTVARSLNDKGRPRSEIVLGDVARIGPFYGKTSAEGGWRVCIVDAADEMNRNAANALLKTLEEPPERSVVILVAHSPGAVLPTIRSRCRMLTLRPLDEDATLRVLAATLPDLDPEAAQSLARLAEGAPGRAVALHAAGGVETYRALIDLIAALPRTDWPKVHGFADRFARKGGEGAWAVFTDLIGWWLARLVRAGASRQLPPEIVGGEAGLISRLIAGTNLDRWVDQWERTNTLLARAEAVNLDKKQVVLNLFAQLERTAGR